VSVSVYMWGTAGACVVFDCTQSAYASKGALALGCHTLLAHPMPAQLGFEVAPVPQLAAASETSTVHREQASKQPQVTHEPLR